MQSEATMALNVNTAISGTVSGIAQLLNVLLSDHNLQNKKCGIDVNLCYKYVKYIFILTFIYTRTIGLVLGIVTGLYKYKRMQAIVAAPVLLMFQLKWTRQLLSD